MPSSRGLFMNGIDKIDKGTCRYLVNIDSIRELEWVTELSLTCLDRRMQFQAYSHPS